MSRSRYLLMLIVILVLLGVGLLSFPAFIRALPGRYAYYLPEPLQELRRGTYPQTLPTPAITATTPVPTPTRIPTSTPTATPTPLPTSLPTDTPTPTPSPMPTLPPSFVLDGIRFEHQGWNNCGPTTLGMALSYWGREETQRQLAPILKPDPEDKHVAIWEMDSYVRSIGLGSIVRVNGTLDRIKTLINEGFPVIIASWHVRDARDQLGHYRLIVGYDDAAEEFILYDSLEGPDLPISYRELDELWRVYNRAYMVVYSPDQWDRLAGILGSDLDDVGMYERAVERLQFEAANPPGNCVAYADCGDWVTFSWFSIGSSLTALGRHEEAAAAYDRARQRGLHFRVLWYQVGPYESYYAVGRYDDVITLANATLSTTKNLEESYYWRGKTRLAQGDQEGARADFEAALRYHQDWPPAVVALEDLGAS